MDSRHMVHRHTLQTLLKRRPTILVDTNLCRPQHPSRPTLQTDTPHHPSQQLLLLLLLPTPILTTIRVPPLLHTLQTATSHLLNLLLRRQHPQLPKLPFLGPRLSTLTIPPSLRRHLGVQTGNHLEATVLTALTSLLSLYLPPRPFMRRMVLQASNSSPKLLPRHLHEGSLTSPPLRQRDRL